MKFIQTDKNETIAQIAAVINQTLSEGNVLLLLSGGSNIDLSVNIRQRLELKNQLTIGLIDERYGPVGHADSNWTKLMKAGFNTGQTRLLPVLENDLSLEETAENYEEKLARATEENHQVIGLFGMGPDGHTAGILPDSPAVESKNLVAYFKGPDFERITTTPIYFNLIDIAFLIAYGEGKRPVLEKLKKDLPVRVQPAQALKDTKQFIVYNDQLS